MNNALFVFSLVLIIMGCSKEEKAMKRLDGEWTIIAYEYLNPSGLTYKYVAGGTMSFGDGGKSLRADYGIDMTYEGSSGSVDFIQEGIYAFTYGDPEFVDLYRSNTMGGTDTIEKARIIMLTKDDLLFQFLEGTGTYTFTCVKN